MTLSIQMAMLVHSLEQGASKRSEALETIRRDTKRHLAESCVSLRLTAETQRTQRSKALHSNRLVTAFLLGQSVKMIEDFQNLRSANSLRLLRQLASGTNNLRTQTSNRLAVLTQTRKNNVLNSQKVRLADKAILKTHVWDMKKRDNALLENLTQDRIAASGMWQTHVDGGAAQLAAQTSQAAKANSSSPSVILETAFNQVIKSNVAPVEVQSEVEIILAAKTEAEAEMAASFKEGSTQLVDPSEQNSKSKNSNTFVYQDTALVQASRRDVIPAEAKREADTKPISKPGVVAKATIDNKDDSTTKNIKPTKS